MGLPTSTNDIIKADISTNNNESSLIENYHIQIQNNNKSNLNRRDELLKNDNTDNKKQVSNIRPDCGVSPKSSSQKLNIEIVRDSIIKME